jgi:uncharacterized membrane protein
MRGAWVTLAAGAVLLIIAVTGFVVVPQHAPTYSDVPPPLGSHYPAPWSTGVYDAGRIITWADLIVGLILVLVGLILTWRRSVTHQTPQGAS